jgi:pyruvate/2-oxoacid:ferredoxin oxidoreductase alpha subunit
MEKELRLMKGNEAIAEAAIRFGADAYFGYPITPQSEVLEYLMSQKPHERTVWLFCKPKAKWLQLIWYMVLQQQDFYQ